MILLLFGFFLVLSIVLIVIGLAKPEESAQVIIGAVFLFLLSLVLINTNLEYKTGEQVNTTYSYVGNTTQINTTIEVSADIYTTYNDDNTHTFGYWLAIGSFMIFLMAILGLKGGFRRGE